MSDSLGMKAVSRVAETDRFPFVKALAHIAVADDAVSVDEKKMVQKYAEAWGLGDDAESEVREILQSGTSLSLAELVAEFSESGTRILLIQELLRLSHADGTYGDAERKEIAKIAKRMGLSKDQFRELEKWVGRGRAWGAIGDGEAEEGPDAEDLKDVLERGEENEYDLSDIETGDSDLSDLGPDEES